jgi:glycosyltransferase involved in cell wall biosynthesis
MRVCKVWDSDYPWDVRVEKIASTLTTQGWDLDLVCRNDARRARRERAGRLHIQRLPCAPRALGPLNRALNFPYFFNPVWLHAIIRACRRARPDVIMVRDLPLALTGLLVGWAHGIPTVLDLAENYPGMLRDIRRYGRFRLSNLLVRSPSVAAAIERRAVRLASHVIVVVDEAKTRLARLGVAPSRISVVSNTPPRSRADAQTRPPRPPDLPEGDPVLLYLGNLDPGRGLDTVIEAMPAVLALAPRARLVIVGSGSQLDGLRARAAHLALGQSVVFTGRLAHTLAQSYVPHADICLVPHDATESNNATISNKLFDYMAAGKPVLASDCPPTARILSAVGCGLVFPARSPSALAAALPQLLDPDHRQRLGDRGLEAVRSRYHWERDADILVRTLAGVAEAGAPARPVRISGLDRPVEH